MEKQQRLIVGAIWIVVAALMAVSVEPEAPSSWVDALRLLVIVVSLALAGLYLFDPKELISKKFEFQR